MSFDFASVRSLTIPEGAVTMITAADGTVLWKLGYTWKKYNTVSQTKYVEVQTSVRQESTGAKSTFYCSYDYTFDSATGKYTLNDPKRTSTSQYGNTRYSTNYVGYPCFIPDGTTTSSKMYKVTSVTYSMQGFFAIGTRYESTLQTTYSRGTYISDITSTDENAYPADGVHTDGYWYIKQS